MPIQSIETRRLYRQIADQIARVIDSGEYRPGERLPAERALADQLSVSRPTVREALIALEVEGRVEIRGGAGVFVLERASEHTSSGINGTSVTPMPGPFEILAARDLIEPDVAALAAKNATPAKITAIADALSDMVVCSAGDNRRLQYDRQFHFAIAEASGNSALALVMQALWTTREQPLYLCLEDHFHNEQVWQRAILEHREILEAIKAGDTKAARAAMHRHLKNVRTRFVSNWQEP